MAILPAVVLGASAVSAGLSLYGKKKAARAAERAARATADLYGKQSGIYLQQAAMYGSAAAAYAGTADLQKRIGEANAAETMRASTQLDDELQFQISAINKQRRAKIGEGRAAFAANGVLVESREGSATAMWEQDEAADAVVEKLALMQTIENEYYNYRVTAKRQIVEGQLAAAGSYSQAAGMAAQAASAASSARLAALQQYYTLKGAKSGGLDWSDWLSAGASILQAGATAYGMSRK